jgi:hypothetical protein
MKPPAGPLSAPASPLRYEPAMERLEPDEAATDTALTETVLGISEAVVDFFPRNRNVGAQIL